MKNCKIYWMMKKLVLGLIFCLLGLGLHAQNQKVAIVIHGGAGTILKKNMTPEKEKAYQDKLNEALDKGYQILKNGGKSENAVVEAIKILEDSPLFNAGKGAVFTSQKQYELDASIMRGSDLNAGAVAGVRYIKNPILGAKAVMEKSKHVMLSGKGADDFAKEQGLEMVENEYFKTKRRWNQIQKITQENQQQKEDTTGLNPDYLSENQKYGTVGVVALDKKGNITAGTSTGGMTNKKYGRIGDSPIIGAGTYADNNTCGVSCTGHGEYFIRATVARDVSAWMELKKYSLQKASKKSLTKNGKIGWNRRVSGVR